MRFRFSSEIYVQTDRIALSSPLENKTKMWKRYVDNIYHLFCKNGLNNLILTTLNSFHSNIKFTIEIEKDSVIPFFCILVSYQNTKQNTEQYTIKKQILIYTFIEILSHQTNGNGKQENFGA